MNNMGGTRPPALGELGAAATLESLLLWDNAFTGTIPWRLGKLTSLSSVYLQSNKLAGCVPKCISACAGTTAAPLGHAKEVRPLYAKA